jgi:hypothetical protein
MNPNPDDKPATWRWALQVFLLLTSSFAVLALYFGIHKPATGAVLAGTARTASSLVFWLAVTFLSAALGRRLVGTQLEKEPPTVRLALSAGLGLAVLSILLMVFGLLGLLARWQLLLLLLGLALLALPGLRATWHDVRAWRWPRAAEGWQRWFLHYAVASLLLALLLALAPPTAWDSLVYHLTGARLYLDAGRVTHALDLPYLGFPALGQMHFLLALAFDLEPAAALFHFGYGLMALALVAALARRLGGEAAAWFAAVLLLSVPSILALMSSPYVDLALLLYTTATFFLFLRWRDAYLAQQDERGWLLLLGAFIGFTGGLKYTAVATPVAVALSMLLAARRSGLVAAVRRVALVALVAVVAVAIWPFKNWLQTGNPVYPFFVDDALYWDAWRGWWFDRPGTGLAATAPWRLLTAPLEASVLGTEGSEMYDATTGPLLLIGLLLLIFTWRALAREARPAGRYLLLFVALNYALWLYGLARTALLVQTRLLFPIFGLLAVLAGAAFAQAERLRRPQLDAGWLLRVIAVLTLALLLVTQFVDFLARNPLPVLVGVESRQSYERRQLGVYADVMATLNQLPPGSRIIFLWEPRSYACRAVECWPDALLDRWLHLTQHQEHDAPAIAASWRTQGFTHVLWYEHGMHFIEEAAFDPLGPSELVILAELQRDYLEPVEVWDGAYTLYGWAE